MKLPTASSQSIREQYLNLFTMFDRAGVPADSRWRSLLLYFREIKDYNHISDAQKVAIQELLTGALTQKDFSDQRFFEILKKYHTIVVKPYQGKVEELLREASEVITGFQEIVTSRYGDLNSLENESVSIIEDETDSTIAIAKLRTAFSKVKTLLEQDIRNLEQMATLDGLTGLANRRAFDLFMNEAVEKWLSEERPLMLALFDIDFFKKFNDEHGHRIGDQVISVVGKHLKNAAKSFTGDNHVMAARYGGEEFALVVSGQDASDLVDAAEKCRDTIKRFNFLIRDSEGNVVESGLHITVSSGAASIVKEWRGAYVANLIDNADKALYFAKQAGRNKVVKFVSNGDKNFVVVTPAEKN